MSQLTNLEEFALQIFLKQMELSPRMPAEALVTTSASLAAKLLNEIGSVHIVQTQPEETEPEKAESENSEQQPGTPFDETLPTCNTEFPEL